MSAIDPRLQQDCVLLGRFRLSRLLLMDDANYPWFILVPDRQDVTEIYHLAADDQCQLIQESSALAAAIAKGFDADKINIAALGNVVPQLHIHHIVRYIDDPAWPAPVWGKVPVTRYTGEALADVLANLREILPADFQFEL